MVIIIVPDQTLPPSFSFWWCTRSETLLIFISIRTSCPNLKPPKILSLKDSGHLSGDISIQELSFHDQTASTEGKERRMMVSLSLSLFSLREALCISAASFLSAHILCFLACVGCCSGWTNTRRRGRFFRGKRTEWNDKATFCGFLKCLPVKPEENFPLERRQK